MRIRLFLHKLVYFLSIAWPSVAFTKTVNPLEYGLHTAKSGIERFEVLKHCHEDAVRIGADISYEGIDSISIDIPNEATSIPLPNVTDFAGVVLTINNTRTKFYLFKRYGRAKPLIVTGEVIDSGDFSRIASLSNGRKMIILQDNAPWINTRLGYNSTTTCKRKDVLVLKNGIAENQTIMPYNNEQTKPVAWVCDLDEEKIEIKNLHVIRSKESTMITHIFGLRFLYGLELRNITITTPVPNIESGDNCMYIEDCAKSTLTDVRIENTYSTDRLTGYGIRLLNVYDVKINRLKSRSNWGLFGNNNVHNVSLADCDINRFDVHYYGKDIYSTNCTFREKYNQFASVYGTVAFKNCQFVQCAPVLIESSFNAYTPFELVWENCTFELNNKHDYLVTLFEVPEPYNDRPELHRKCLPNITIKKCRVKLTNDMKKWYLIWTGGVKYKDSFDYISKININGLRVENEGNRKFEIFSEKIKTTNAVNISIKRKKK